MVALHWKIFDTLKFRHGHKSTIQFKPFAMVTTTHLALRTGMINEYIPSVSAYIRQAVQLMVFGTRQ